MVISPVDPSTDIFMGDTSPGEMLLPEDAVLSSVPASELSAEVDPWDAPESDSLLLPQAARLKAMAPVRAHAVTFLHTFRFILKTSYTIFLFCTVTV
jgi:hypothetical protein